MVTYNEIMRIPMFDKSMWKFSGECEVSSQHQAQCWDCGETKLCWAIPVEICETSCCGPVADPFAYYCDECKANHD
jgi:hypothetical protein